MTCAGDGYCCIFFTLCDATDDVTWVILGHQRFSSISSDQIEIYAPLVVLVVKVPDW